MSRARTSSSNTVRWRIKAIGCRTQRRVTANTVAPIVIPIRNIPRISVKTYVELPVPDDSSRVHRTWYPSDVRPETNASRRARVGRRSSDDAELAGVHEGSRHAADEASSAASYSVSAPRLSSSATAPAVPEQAAAITSVPVSPKTSIRTRPAASVPAIAPSVFAA